MKTSQLNCYGITRAAMQLLLKQPTLPMDVPVGWFNWLNPNKSSKSELAVQRLQLLDVERGPTQVLTWSRTAREAGYNCVLVYSTTDNPSFTADASDDYSSLEDDVVLFPVSDRPIADEWGELGELLDQLREPERLISGGWAYFRDGGKKRNIALDDYSRVTLPQWLAYGASFKEWIAKTAPGQEWQECRVNTVDFSKWNWLKAQGVNEPDIKLDLNSCWNSPQDGVWPWSLQHPVTDREISNLDDQGFVEYYPMRQMPCCGVAITKVGAWVPFGALTEDLAWADADTLKVFARIAEKQRPVGPTIVDRIYKFTRKFGYSKNSIGSISRAEAQSTPSSNQYSHLNQNSFGFVDPSVSSTEISSQNFSEETHGVEIQWDEPWGDGLATFKLVAKRNAVHLYCVSGISQNSPQPLALMRRCERPDDVCHLSQVGDHWVVLNLELADVIRVQRLFCQDGSNGDKFVVKGYKIVAGEN